MQAAINEVLSRTASKTADYTYAHATLGYSENVTNQTTIEKKLEDILKFCDHVGYWNGNTLHVIDLVTGGAVNAISSARVKNVTSKLDTSIVSSLKASYQYRVHDGGDLSSPPTLTNETIDITLATGLDGGIEKDINNKISAAKVDTGAVVYDDVNLNLHLTRKKTLELREPVTITADGYLSYNIGDKITYDTAYESGYLIIEKLTFNDERLETVLYGRGEYTGKAP